MTSFMNSAITLTQTQLSDFLLNVAIVRPVFIWGQPGIGKSSLVQEFAAQVGLDCVSLLGSQLAPEDLIGVPQILDGTSRFCPPRTIARAEPYCLFLDELERTLDPTFSVCRRSTMGATSGRAADVGRQHRWENRGPRASRLQRGRVSR